MAHTETAQKIAKIPPPPFKVSSSFVWPLLKNTCSQINLSQKMLQNITSFACQYATHSSYLTGNVTISSMVH